MHNRLKQLYLVWPLLLIGSLAIVVGGMISAFGASSPSRATMWTSAYIVLVMGVLQLLFAFGMVFSLKSISKKLVYAVLSGLNIGAGTIILARALKPQLDGDMSLMITGSAVYILTMLILLVSLRGSTASWWRFAYITVVIIGLLGAVVGLCLSVAID